MTKATALNDSKRAPWLKFYISDWRSDPAVRICSLAARGLWFEMLCLMHESEPRGSLRVKGIAINDKQLASLVGATAREASALLAELEAAGVFSRDFDNTIYSRRMRKDEAKAARDKAYGSMGGNPLLKVGLTPPDKPSGNGEHKAYSARTIATQKLQESNLPTEIQSAASRKRGALDPRQRAALTAAAQKNRSDPVALSDELSSLMSRVGKGKQGP